MNAKGSRHDRRRWAAPALALLLAAPAQAQPRDAAGSEWLFREGRALMRQGDLAAACPKLAESLRFDPAVGTLMNLAECEELQGRTASAWQRWGAAADQLPTNDPRRATALARVRALEASVPRLIVTVASMAPGGLVVTRDGITLGAASIGVPLPVDPGRHVVLATASGRAPRAYEVTLESGQQQTLVVDAGPARKATPAPAPAVAVQATAPPRGRSRLVGYGLVTGGVAALAAGGFFGLQALSARNQADDLCVERGAANRCWSTAERALERDRRWSIAADVAFGAGALATAGGLYLLLRRSSEAGRPQAQIVPLAGGGGIQLAGGF